MTNTPATPSGPRYGSIAFLLAQVGAQAAALFAERIAVLDLTPPQAGLLRAVAREAGLSQQRFAAQLGVPPSRFVALVDTLEQRGLLERRRSTADRRAYGLFLTADGERMMQELGRIARAHDDDLCRGLDERQRDALRQALVHIADTHTLIPGVHPGYRSEEST